MIRRGSVYRTTAARDGDWSVVDCDDLAGSGGLTGDDDCR